jgi:hypothetical protein
MTDTNERHAFVAPPVAPAPKCGDSWTLSCLTERALATQARTLDALRDAVNEIEGQLSANSALYWKRSSTRIYWRQVVGVLRAALTTEPTP